jgi:hypothetical protein
VRSELDPEKCPEWVSTPGMRMKLHQCTKLIWKDGFCKIHHPEKVAERQRKSEENYRLTSPWEKLRLAYEKIEKLELEIQRLKSNER